jgi:plastocyanin
MKLRGFLTGGALAAALALTACGGGSSAASSGGAQPITIGTDKGVELKFEPNNVTAPANSTVKLTFNNVSTQPHNLHFQQGIDAKTAESVAPGTSETIDVKTPAPGNYEFVCTIHPTMKGTLTVK